ncbi:MAG TPA: phosphoribosyltransferase family protein [Azospirillum sp.]
MNDRLFHDRTEAGRRLAASLLRFKERKPVVLALPRGGVAVAAEVARALGAPLDVVLVRKIGAPYQPELAVGAVADGGRVEVALNPKVLRFVSPEWFEEEKARQLAEIDRRRGLYLRGRPRAAVAGRTAIVVDDGIATGATVRAALRSVRRAGPRRLVLAVPVAPRDTLAALSGEVDEVVCLTTPEPFEAIGCYYGDFRQLDDDDVIRLLDEAAAPPDLGTP